MARWVMPCLVVLLVLVGCDDVSVPEDDIFSVALVTPGPISDGGWNTAAHEGLKRIESELGATTSHVEVSTPASYEETFRDFARQGFDVVIGHGFEFQDAAVTVAADYPQTAFLVTSGLEVRDNVAGLVFRLEEAAYLGGVLAAGLSETGSVGMVGGMEIPPVRLVFDGFRRGFLDTNPGGQTKTVFVGNWEDVASARQATLALLDQGVDVVIHNADAAGLGVFRACRERGAYALGTNSDQASIAPDVVIASAVIDIPAALTELAREVKEGRFTGQIHAFDLRSGIVDLAINSQRADVISDDLRTELENARNALMTGAVQLEHFGPQPEPISSDEGAPPQ